MIDLMIVAGVLIAGIFTISSRLREIKVELHMIEWDLSHLYYLAKSVNEEK